jgi:hypothetical protein
MGGGPRRCVQGIRGAPKGFVVTQDKKVILPSLDNTTDVTCNVSTSSPSVTLEVLSNMLVDHNKTMISQMQQTMEEGIDRFLES